MLKKDPDKLNSEEVMKLFHEKLFKIDTNQVALMVYGTLENILDHKIADFII